MKIAILQLNPTVGDIENNTIKIIAGYQQACAMGAKLVVGTELCLFGFPPRDLLLREDFLQEQDSYLHMMAEFIGQTGLIVGAASCNLNAGKPLFNSAVLLQNGKFKAIVNKRLLPNYDVFEERIYFEPSLESDCVVSYDLRHREDCWSTLNGEGVGIAILICEELWFDATGKDGQKLYAEDPFLPLTLNPPRLIVAINASPYYWGKGDARFNLISGIAKRVGCPVVYANQAGGNDELIFDGRSFVVDAEGNCISPVKAFSESLILVDLANPEPRKYPSDTGNLADLHDALVLGIRDYCHKTGFTQAVIGLSGGVDSSVTVCLAVDALGAENVLGVYMPSPFSSDESRLDAQVQAENLGIGFKVAPISEAYTAFQHTLEPIVGWNAPGTVPGAVTAENVQARVRGAILMGIANSTPGMMVLSTGNKSELAMGYCTLYGDMVGGLAVISDLPKTLVYKLAEHLNRNCEIIPKNILTKAPSAELAPGQKDTDSLPPYEILDPILRLYIEERMGIAEIATEGYDPEIVRRVVQMVNRAEHKQRQMAPGLKVTKAFGSGRRMPIAAKFPNNHEEI